MGAFLSSPEKREFLSQSQARGGYDRKIDSTYKKNSSYQYSNSCLSCYVQFTH